MNVEALDLMWQAGVPIACNQVQMSLFDRRPLNGMVEYCREKKIKLLTYGSLGGGREGERKRGREGRRERERGE